MGTLEYVRGIDVKVYNEFRDMVGWGSLPEEEAATGILYSYDTVSCKCEGKTVGIARLVWDHGYIAFLSDVIVHPDYRGRGIGKEMVTRFIEELRAQMKPGWRIKVSLMAALGKEPFYEKMGFQRRPNEYGGSGMDMWLTSEQ